MTPNPTLPAARQWWQGQRKRRKGFAIGGVAAVMLIGASAASGGREPATEAAPTTSAGVSREHVSPSTTTGRTEPPTTAAIVPPTTAAPTTTPPPTTLPVTYTVVAVIDGDTIDVAPSDGSTGVRVRMIGIDAPETGSCEADAATWTLTSLVQDQHVTITPGGDGEDTDRYGRLLRFVDVNGVDAGLRLVEDGLVVARYDSRDGYGAHAREASYITADEGSPAYACPPPTTQAPAPPPPAPAPLPTVIPPPAPSGGGDGCDPNYTPCVPIDSDVDCRSGSGNGPSYVSGPVRVIGSDIYGLDGNDNDGIGCE